MRFVIVLAIAALATSATGTAASADAACDAATARSALNGYVQAFNGGQYVTLQHLLAEEPGFAWYAVAPPHGRINQRSQNRSTLMTYLRARHGRGRSIVRSYGAEPFSDLLLGLLPKEKA